MAKPITLTNLTSEPLLYNGQHIMVGETFLVTNYEYDWACQAIIDDVNAEKVAVGDGTALITDKDLAIKYLQANDSSVLERYTCETYGSNNLITLEAYYAYKSVLGAYSGKVREIVYTYVGQANTQIVESSYALNGSLLKQNTTKFYTDKTNKKYIKELS